MNLCSRLGVVAAVVLGILAFILLELVRKFVLLKPWLRYFIRRNSLEIYTAIGAVAGYLIVYFFSKKEGMSLALSILVTVIGTMVIIYSKTRQRGFYFLPLWSRKEKDDWIGTGHFEYDRDKKAYIITDSHSGFIFSKCLSWSDYKFDFEFKILNSSIGAIVRATDLSNLIMLQILDHGIKPHIFVNGFWKDFDPKSENLEFRDKLLLDDWYKCELTCNKRSISLRISDIKGSPVFDRVWIIPSGQFVLSSQGIGQGTSTTIPIPYAINREFGTVGFRNSGTESAAVKNVLIDKKL